MGKKMRLLPAFFRSRDSPPDRQWQWPICGVSKTPSFAAGDEIFKTVNSVLFDDSVSDRVQTPDSWFTNSSLSESGNVFSDDEFEMVVRGAKSERLIFEPGETNSILEKPAGEGDGELVRFEGSVILAMQSDDPHLDFRRSMEEMVESHGIKDWDSLEALLNWYLRVNRTKNHGYILGAFVDLLVELGGDGCTDSTSIFSDELIIETSPSSSITQVKAWPLTTAGMRYGQ